MGFSCDYDDEAASLARLSAETLVACQWARRLAATAILSLIAVAWAKADDLIPHTSRLTMSGDIASQLVDGVDRFLLRKIDESTARRARHWHRDLASRESFDQSIEPNRRRLAQILGVRDLRVERVEFDHRYLGRATVGGVHVFVAKWSAFGDVQGHGLILLPADLATRGAVIVLPDADQTPEQSAGLSPGIAPEGQIARRLAESGYAVVVPALISRQVEARNGRAKLTHREFLYRPAFELGRHVIGYETQKVLAIVDAIKASASVTQKSSSAVVGVWGYGEGGLIALAAAALDPRIDVTIVSGFFDERNDVWKQPIDRNVFGLLDQFGDAELAAMVAGRDLVIHDAAGPLASLAGEGGAPAELASPRRAAAEFDRFRQIVGDHPLWRRASFLPEAWSDALWREVLSRLEKPASDSVQTGEAVRSGEGGLFAAAPGLEIVEAFTTKIVQASDLPDAARRQRAMVHEIDRHNQQLLEQSAYVRAEFMKQLDVSSLEKYSATVEPYRQKFRDDVIGRFDDPLLPPNPKSRQIFDRPGWIAHEVVLDVWPNVIAYGVLLMPKGIGKGERRPVVVCQHGLEGRPLDTIDGDNPAYHDFAAKLADRGFITFAPQNLYIFTDRFRSLQRKANPLGKTLFSIIVPQHQQITDWLKTLPQVDPERIAFYGLSYGGKSAMRIPPLVQNYCLSICSADYNEWVWKNASTSSPYSYVWSGEYEIFEFDLGSTFNYAEMAALIAPRPFMVERGHFDGVAPDEMVAHEFAKARRLYAAQLGIGDRCEIETFVGPHTINGRGTFDFLSRHLRWSNHSSPTP